MPYDVYDRIALAREAAEDAEVELFDPAIEDAIEAGDRRTGENLKKDTGTFESLTKSIIRCP